MRIKRFIEYSSLKEKKLFDDEELKSRNEIDYLSGKLSNIGKRVDIGESENMAKLVTKISTVHYPFFQAFLDEVESEKDLSFGDFFIRTVPDEKDGYWILTTRSNDSVVALGIRINKLNNYDMYIYMGDYNNPEDKDKNYGFEKNGIDYNELIRLIKEYYIPFLQEANFDELLDYNKGTGINN